MSTPPVREASTKPSAATVLPAPVACSNQKRRAALGSSGCSSSWPLLALVLPVLGLLVFGLVLVEVDVDVVVVVSPPAAGSGRAAVASRRPGCRRGARAPAGSGSVAVAVALGLGQQRGQRARECVDLMGGEHRAVDEVGLLLGEQPLETEQQ